jgi:UDP-N-acetylglucosamine 2-epimerase (non-hydrolysing)
MANAVNPYGDGRAAERSVAAIAELLGVGHRAPDFDPRRSDPVIGDDLDDDLVTA